MAQEVNSMGLLTWKITMEKKKREPCPAGIEDRCPIPRYRCREVGEPGRHCFELFAEFEAFVLPDPKNDESDAETGRVLPFPRGRRKNRT
jgi:hypothetical protein